MELTIDVVPLCDRRPGCVPENIRAILRMEMGGMLWHTSPVARGSYGSDDWAEAVAAAGKMVAAAIAERISGVSVAVRVLPSTVCRIP